jgi:hypothetical protein
VGRTYEPLHRGNYRSESGIPAGSFLTLRNASHFVVENNEQGLYKYGTGQKDQRGLSWQLIHPCKIALLPNYIHASRPQQIHRESRQFQSS